MARPPNVHVGHGNIHKPPHRPAHKLHKPTTNKPKGTVKPQKKPVAPPPFNANQAAQEAYGNQVRSNQQSDDDLDLTEYAQQSGIQYNPATGQFGGFDPTNPFSQAALLMKSRHERDQGQNTSYAASGQLYSGAYQSAKQETGFQYDRGYDTLRRGLDDYVKNYGRRKRDRNLVPPPAPA